MKNKLFALALAGVTVIGALATGTSVMAGNDPIQSGGGEPSGNTTKVTLTVEPKNQYTLTIPSTTTLDKAEAVALDGGITVTGSNMENSVTVTASTKSDWKLSAEKANTTIGYGLYDTESATTSKTSWDFEAADINNAGKQGVNKAVYGKVNTDDVKKADAGNYSDTITFTAEVNKAPQMTVADYFKNGAEVKFELQVKDKEGTEHNIIAEGKRENDTLTLTGGTYDDGKKLTLSEDDAYSSDEDCIYADVISGSSSDTIYFNAYKGGACNELTQMTLNPNGYSYCNSYNGSTVISKKVFVNGTDITDKFTFA